MARNNNKMTKARKLEPAVQTLTFNVITSPGSTQYQYIDIGLAVSIANRRSYRQGLTWAVSGISVFPTQGTGSILTAKLPETWALANSWEKSFAMWTKMNDQVLDDEPSIKGKYHDFKIYADATMATAEVQTAGYAGLGPFILTPIDSAGNLTAADYTGVGTVRADWNYSQLTIPNDPAAVAPATSVDYTLHAVGDDTATSKAMIKGYALSRSRPQAQDPNIPTVGGWMTELFDVGEQLDELREVIEDDNDRPPYAVQPHGSPLESYPGGALEFPSMQLHETAYVTGTTVSNHIRLSGGLFPCGLIKLGLSPDVEVGFDSVSIQVHLVPGNHRGYMAQPMQDM